MSSVLPEGLTEDRFRKALSAFRGIVGDDFVHENGPELDRYRDPYTVLEDELRPGAAVQPASVEEVSNVLRMATELGVPVSPISTGRNLGYGAAAPRLSGAVVLDLSRLNRIIEVDATFGYALVEPGVTYFDLYNHLREHNLPFWLDVPDLGWGSVIGNTMERGVGYTPYGDHLGIQCGMEVVLPDGDVVRTGMGALPGSNTWQLFKYGYGPYFDPMFTQGNFGVVTKMGVWLMPEPPGYRAYLITLPREEDLGPFVDLLRPLRMSGAIPNVPTLRNVWLDAAATYRRRDLYDGTGELPSAVARQVMEEQDIGWWNFYGALYGTPQAMQASWSMIREVFSAIPGARFHLQGEHPSPVLATRAKIMAGEPTLEPLELVHWVDNGGHVDFAPVSPATGADALRQYAMVRDRCREYGKDYLGMFIVGRREMHHISLMVFDTTDRDDKSRTLGLCRRLIGEAAEHGYGEYRIHPALMDDVAGTFGYNNHALRRLAERIKDAVDPAGILAPGKQGIWPRDRR
ncbi:FAD-binding oxidoreductase [Actinoplanes sp. N902-109]|uniref:FAD-binding oxidoreductase n=1 Tax=Actinoplanes sp. (strain N902-109) TaxID=649831 RepID=UPI0003295590|nr:FAD-binding oxidoreductase [Actinoplanes sp. N902-109]AGL20666.1 vanillyl-alcohol oxidase [Actinoplanes sp. N902-109]